MKLTEEQIEAGRSAKGGWTRAQLAKWGVPWPPPKGWRWALTHGRDPLQVHRENQPITQNQDPAHYRMKTSAQDFPNLPFARFYFRKPFARS